MFLKKRRDWFLEIRFEVGWKKRLMEVWRLIYLRSMFLKTLIVFETLLKKRIESLQILVFLDSLLFLLQSEKDLKTSELKDLIPEVPVFRFNSYLIWKKFLLVRLFGSLERRYIIISERNWSAFGKYCDRYSRN